MRVVPAVRAVKENSNTQASLPVRPHGTFLAERQLILSVRVLLSSLQESWRCEKLETRGFTPMGDLFSLLIVLNEFHAQNIYNRNLLAAIS